MPDNDNLLYKARIYFPLPFLAALAPFMEVDTDSAWLVYAIIAVDSLLAISISALFFALAIKLFI